MVHQHQRTTQQKQKIVCPIMQEIFSCNKVSSHTQQSDTTPPPSLLFNPHSHHTSHINTMHLQRKKKGGVICFHIFINRKTLHMHAKNLVKIHGYGWNWKKVVNLSQHFVLDLLLFLFTYIMIFFFWIYCFVRTMEEEVMK